MQKYFYIFIIFSELTANIILFKNIKIYIMLTLFYIFILFSELITNISFKNKIIMQNILGLLSF